MRALCRLALSLTGARDRRTGPRWPANRQSGRVGFAGAGAGMEALSGLVLGTWTSGDRALPGPPTALTNDLTY